MTKIAKNICPKCQSLIQEDAPGGLCPKCVLGGVGTAAADPAVGTDELPSIQHLATLFPQLEIIELIGRGGMGFVYRARQRHLDREVALKLLPAKFGADPHFAERFTREARVLAKLSHPNIVMVHDFGQIGGFYYFAMEYIEGLNLREAMRMGKFSPAEALAIVPKICEALQYAHEQGVLHRDIKPENILLDARGRVKIADFGIAKMLGEDPANLTLTGTGSALGTPHYMAPEQFENPSQVDHRADIYSLGVVFYEMLTGELPIGRFSAPSQRTDLDERIDAVVLRALARERELRQKDARELQSQVESLTESGAGSSARGKSVRRRLWSEPWKLAAVFGGVVCLLVAFLNWRARSFWEGQYRRAMLQQTPAASQEALSFVPTVNGTTLLFSNAASNAGSSMVDPEQLKAEEEKIEAARSRYEAARERHARGEISDRDLALFNRDLAIAEARGDAERVARAHYDFADRDYRRVAQENPSNQDALYQAEQELNKAQHAIERAKATNELQRALADVKFAEWALGSAQRRRELRVDRNGVLTNFISAEALKKLENDYFYSDMNYQRLKQKKL